MGQRGAILQAVDASDRALCDDDGLNGAIGSIPYFMSEALLREQPDLVRLFVEG